MELLGHESPSREAVASRASSLACLECRRQHLRCDAGHPACRRCVAARRPCYYAPSRRGRKRRRDDDSTAVNQDTDSAATTAATAIATHSSAPELLGSLHVGFDSTFTFQSPLQQPLGNVVALNNNENNENVAAVDQYKYIVDSGGSDSLVDLYYNYFHRAHPFLVPRRFYHAQQYPRYLQLAVQFVGSHYASSGCEGRGLHRRTELLRDLVGSSILAMAMADNTTTTHRTVGMVQALTMLAIALHARHELAESDMAVSRAVQLAVELGMHRQDFARSRSGARNSGWNSVREESLRRTWWELYVVDGYLAALHHKSSFRANAVVKNGGVGVGVLLPCEEAAYARAGDGESLPMPLSLEDFDARMFTNEDEISARLRFSSFAYRIDAVRLLGRVLAVSRTSQTAHIHEHTDTSDTFSAVDSALAGWVHHLHPTKAEVVSRDGAVLDEMLFQAHMLVQYASLVLHCPRSDLVVTLPAAARISCGQAHGAGAGAGAGSQHLHSAKATQASTRLTGLAALCSPVVQEHTPFFVCGLLLGATVQLAACASRPVLRWQFRDSVLLAIGVLKTLGRTWALAHNALRLLRDVAGEVMQQSVHGSSIDVDVDVDVDEDADDWHARTVINTNTVSAPAGDDALDGFPDLMQSPDELGQLDQLDQLDQWTLPLMLQLNDHQSSHSASLC